MAIKSTNPSQSSSEGLSDSGTDDNQVANEVVESQNDDAASSTAQEDSKQAEETEHKTLLDVVKDVVAKSEEESEKAAKTDDEEEGEESKAGESSTPEDKKSGKKDSETVTDFTKEELEKEKPSTRKRIEKLLDEKFEATKLVDQYKPQAESFGQISGFMRENGIANEEAAEAFTIMAMVKSNPQEALKRMRVHIDNIAQAVGEILPADLAKKVEDGTLDEDTAKELSVARASAAREAALHQDLQTKTTEEKKQTQAVETAQVLANTLNNWQSNKSKTDPDYSKKHDLLKVYIQAAIAEKGRPENPAQVAAIADEAYGKVTAALAKVIPTQKLQPKKTVLTRNVSGPSPKVAPTNTLEIIKAAVGKR